MAEQKHYLTKKGLEKLEKEYQKLLGIKKKKTTGEDVPSIWHSEEVNPDYLTFQEDMSLLEARLADLELILKNTELITPPPKAKRTEVCLGATVIVEVGGQKDEFTLVGSMEANPGAGMISNESPVGKMLLGHKAGDTVVVNSTVAVAYKILKISYSYT